MSHRTKKYAQADMLSLIHSLHLGAEKCKRRAKEVLYWLGMNAQIEDVLNCQTCCVYQRRNMKEPLLCHKVPSRPWAKVGADIFELQGNSYLVLVDYYSGFIEVNQLRNINSCKHIPIQSSNVESTLSSIKWEGGKGCANCQESN